MKKKTCMISILWKPVQKSNSLPHSISQNKEKKNTQRKKTKKSKITEPTDNWEK